MWRYNELIEVVPVLYLYSILRLAFFLQVCQFSVTSIDSTNYHLRVGNMHIYVY